MGSLGVSLRLADPPLPPLLELAAPSLCGLGSLGVGLDDFVCDWLSSLFLSTLALDTAARVWDCYLRDGEALLWRVAAARVAAHAAALSAAHARDASLTTRPQARRRRAAPAARAAAAAGSLPRRGPLAAAPRVRVGRRGRTCLSPRCCAALARPASRTRRCRSLGERQLFGALAASEGTAHEMLRLDFSQRLPMPTLASGGVVFDLWTNSYEAELGAGAAAAPRAYERAASGLRMADGDRARSGDRQLFLSP